MTCLECELALGLKESSPSIDEHLAVCPACRALVLELQANSEALAILRRDEMPPIRYRVMAQIQAKERARKVARWGWALAAAAMIVVIAGGSLIQPPSKHQIESAAASLVAEKPPIIKRVPARLPKRLTLRKVTKTRSQALKVKMLTSDPDVVIYWIVEAKEGTE